MPFFHHTVSNDPATFRRRMGYALVLVFLALSLLLGRLSYLQVVRQSHYLSAAESNRTVLIPVTPQRGLVRDRNGELIARNRWAFSLEITPSAIKPYTLDELIAGLAGVVDISPADLRRFKRLREDSRRFEAIPIRTQLTEEEVAKFVANRWRFPGVEVAPQEFREYPQGKTASHLIGYVGRISRSDIQRLENEELTDEYQGSHIIGKVGIERSYETLLHGHPGHEMIEVTAGGRPVRSLGAIEPENGRDLELGIDLNLQRIAESALGDEPGAAIAIEPKTGEILAFVSTPTYDPNSFPNGIDPITWEDLSQDTNKPLLNRAARGIYPIGSTYKPFMALAGLHYGLITPKTTINDTGVFEYHNHKFRDASRVPKGRVNLHRSIVVSSDVYYYWLASELGVERIHDFMVPWGFGQKTGIDIVGEQQGTLPSPEWKLRRFKQPWFPGDTVSLGIGQGYNQFTLLQLAHAVATLANRGVSMTPHLVRRVIDPASGKSTDLFSEPTHHIDIASSHLSAVIAAMADVPRTGTARRPFEGVTYSVAGKTGTAQVVTIAQDKRYDATKLSRQHHDHGLFIAFAPVDNPQIAIAVLKENGGFGATAAAPVVREMLDYWITGKNRLGLPIPAHLANLSASSATSK